MDCIRCENPIPAARMEALPETELCIGCSAAVGSDFVLSTRLVRTNKEGSMKVNYGGVEVKLVRRKIVPLRFGGK
ncbi:MAG: TraR/DksA C4-type zinc finger protein [Candidatus Melainabacteria bacterium]|nr:TraR/DksA C4-type zinc finger protein [Candidatus Melainabacteria bacterium]